MILNRYEIFLKTAEIGNITKTAEILHYTQAGISHAIAALEKETGFSICHCHGFPRKCSGGHPHYGWFSDNGYLLHHGQKHGQ